MDLGFINNFNSGIVCCRDAVLRTEEWVVRKLQRTLIVSMKISPCTGKGTS